MPKVFQASHHTNNQMDAAHGLAYVFGKQFLQRAAILIVVKYEV